MTLPPDPIPSPWKTLRQTSLRLFCGLILLALLWSLWYAYAAHRLNSKLAEYRARGEPADPKDLIPPPLDPKDNAYELAMSADRSLTLTADEDDLVNGSTRTEPLSLPLSAADMNTARTMLEHHAPTLRLIEQMRAARSAAWPMDPLPFLPGSPPTKLAPMRRLASFCYSAALFYHQEHQDGLALEAVLEIHALSAIADRCPLLIGHLVAISCDALASRTLLDLAPDLHVQSAADPQAVPRDQVIGLIRDLSDRQILDEPLRRSLRTEHIFCIVFARRAAHRTLLLRPMFFLSACRSLAYQDAFVRAMDPSGQTYPAAKALFPPPPPVNTNLQAAVHVLDSDDGSISRVFVLHYRAATDRAAAGLRLAIRLYELDHRGEFPPSLAELVPAYLSEVTEDPFRADGGPFVYVRARRLFYSVGEDGADDGGPSPPPANRWSAADAVYLLDRVAPRSPAPVTVAPPRSPPFGPSPGGGGFFPAPAPTTTRSTAPAPPAPAGN